MKTLTLLVGMVLLVAAMYFHALAQANVIKPVDRAWYDRLFTGNRATKDNLNDEGLRNRKLSNQSALAGFVMIGVYVCLHYIG